jgi:hypothetical protein
MRHRRIDIFGHQTTLRLEEPFWTLLEEIRRQTGVSLRTFIEIIAMTERVAFSAAQVLTRFPQPPANLVCALIVGSAEIPQPARERLQLLGADVTHAICGHGLVDVERAVFSDDARVTTARASASISF